MYSKRDIDQQKYKKTSGFANILQFATIKPDYIFIRQDCPSKKESGQVGTPRICCPRMSILGFGRTAGQKEQVILKIAFRQDDGNGRLQMEALALHVCRTQQFLLPKVHR